MKTKLTSFLMIVFMLVAFAAIVQAAPAGKVTNLEGRADLTMPGKPARALSIGDAVSVGDIIRTKSGSKLEVTWIDGGIIRLSESSRLKVTEYTLGKTTRTTILSLFRGKVQNVVTATAKLFGQQDGSKYEVHTPTSVCGVRGTTFFSYHENGVSGALFTEGKGYMYSKGQPGNVKPVAPGILMIVTSANKPPEAKPAKQGDANKLFNATNPSGKKKDDKKSEDDKGQGGGGAAGAGGGTSASGSGDTGGTTGEPMLGGDPTATLGTAPPGTTLGGSAGEVVTTTVVGPIVEPTPVVPVVPPTPTDTFTILTQNVTLGDLTGTLDGKISNTTNTGTISLTGTGMESIYVLPTTGTLSDGSTDNAYLAGIPGSWRGLFTGLSNKGGVLSFLKGNLSGTYTPGETEGSLSASGSIVRQATGYTSTGSYGSLGNIYIPVFNSVYVGSSLDISASYDTISGYVTPAGTQMGIWGIQTAGGQYSNEQSIQTWTTKIGSFYNYYSSSYAFLGDAQVTDDLQGHLSISGENVTYLDRSYLGSLGLQYRTTYNGNAYDAAIGTGTAIMQPLAFSGDWGMGMMPSCLFSNETGNYTWVASDPGILGGLNPFWSGSGSSFLAMGNYNLTPSKSHYLWNTPIYGSQTERYSGEYLAQFRGYTAGLWIPGATTTNNAAYAVYVDLNGVPGLLISNNVNMTTYSTVNMWKAEGALNPYPSGDPGGVYYYPETGTIMNGKLAGYFTINDQPTGTILGYQNQSYTYPSETLYLTTYESQNLPWGIYNLRLGLGNTFSGKPTGTSLWSAKLGGQGQFSESNTGYWLANITNGSWTEDGQITANMSGSYLTPTYKGVTESSPFNGINSSSGNWVGQSIGNYQGQLLAYSADTLSGNWARYDAATGLIPDDRGSFSGIIGGVSGFFGGTADINGMGTYYRNANSPLFAMTLVNAYGGPETNSFQLYYGGAAHPASRDYGEWFEGKMMGFYAKWNGTKYTEFGLLSSDKLIVDGEDSGYSVDGNLYPGIGMWNMVDYEYQGRLASTKMADADATTFTVEEYGWSPPAPIAGDLQGTMQMQTAKILEVNDAWGIWMSAMGGSYTDSIPAEWTSRTGWKETNAYGTSYSLATITGYYFEEDGGLWGDVKGRSLNPATMGVFTGDMVGITNNGNWQAMGLGSYEDTSLAYNGAFVQDNSGFGYWDFVNKKFVTEDSSTPPLPLAKIGGLVGGVGELFNGQGVKGANLPVDLTGIGEYDATKVNNYAMFGTDIAGNNDVYATATNNYLLKFGGVRKSDGAGGALLGKGLGLYYRQTAEEVYEVGLLSSSLIPARLYPAIGDPANPGMWEIPEDAGSTLLASAKNTVQGLADPPVLNPVHDDLTRRGAIGTAAQKLGDISLDSTGYLGQNWGILYGGFGLDQGVLPVGSTALAGGTMLYEGGATPVTIGYWMGNISNIEALDNYTTGTYSGNSIFFDAQNRVFQMGVVNTNPSALGANLVAVNSGSHQVGMTLADYMTTPMAFGSMINGSVQQIVNGTFYAREYDQLYVFQGYFPPLTYEYNYFSYPTATSDATNGMAFEIIERQGNDHGTYDERYHYMYTGNYVGTTSEHYISQVFQGGRTSSLSPIPNFTDALPVSPHFDSSLIVDGTTWFTADKYVKTLTSQWDNVNALVHDVPFKGILGGIPGENLWSATTVSDPAQISLIGSVDTPAQYVTFSGNIAGTTDSVSEIPTNAYFASIGGILLGSDSGPSPLTGGVIGLYINQDNPSAPKAGILHGSFSGNAYAGIDMWNGTGGLWVEEKTVTGTLPGAGGLLTPEHPSLFTGVLGVDINDNFVGSFLDDQNASSGLIQSQIVTLGTTYSITGQTDWGIFTMTHAMNNTYSNPYEKTAWASAFAGAAEFGGYLSHNTNWTYRDAGYWKATVTDGTWANGQIGGTVAGEFLSHKKYGTLTGKIQGVYTADAVGGTTGTWQDIIGGAWQKTGDVYFSSAVYGRAYTLRHSQQGGAEYDKESGIKNYYSFYYEDDHAIWPDQYADATYTNNVDQRKTIYRFEMDGMPASPVYRKDTWTQNLSDGTYTFAQTVYETRDEYLSAMAALENKPLEEGTGTVPHQEYYTLGENSAFYGLMAGVGNLWANVGSSTATPLRFAGDIDQFDTAERGFSLFAAQIVSFDPLTTLDPFMNSRTPDWNGKSGAYLANMGGIVDNKQNLTGSLQGLYLDDNGNVGIFYGDLAGRHDTALSMWGAEGSAYTYLMNTSSEITGLGLTPENFASRLQSYTNWNSISDPGLAGENVIGTDGSAIHLSTIQDTKIKLPSVYGGFNPTWNVDQTLLGGTYAGKPSGWTWTFNSPEAGQPLPNDTDWASVQIAPSDTTNAFTGQMAGAKVNWAEGVTKVSGAEIKGLFDPVATTWKAVAQGTSMETSAFVNLVNSFTTDAEKNAFMAALKIPCISVGSTDLRGNGSVTGGSINLGSPSDASKGILNAAFYAFSTGAKPQVWASSLVNGAYTGSPTAGTVNLSGYAPNTQTANGITANFNVQQFGATTWGATVTNGSAPANSLTAPQGGSATHAAITFQGGAAGKIDSIPVGGTPGAFSGTAAGIAK